MISAARSKTHSGAKAKPQDRRPRGHEVMDTLGITNTFYHGAWNAAIPGGR